MSKIETTNKVLLKLTSQINLGRRGARAHRALDFGHSPQPPSLPPPPTAQKGPKALCLGINVYPTNQNLMQSVDYMNLEDLQMQKRSVPTDKAQRVN